MISQMKLKLTEPELILAIKNKQPKGAEALYEMYSSNLYRVIYKIVKHQELAEDILQQVFLRIWQSIDQYHIQRGKLYTWMITIASNLSKDALRTRSYKNQSTHSDIDAVSFDVDNQHHSVMNIEHIGIRESLGSLKTAQREILQLIYFQGYTHVEAADELGIPLGTVKTRWSQGIRKLRQLLSA